METTPRLQLPYILPSQAQKHVTHNEALKLLDGLVQPVVKSSTLTAPPVSPGEGDGYLVPSGATGTWNDHVNSIAIFQDGAWQFIDPQAGWHVYDAGAGDRLFYDGGTWKSAEAGGAALPFFGVNTEADSTNRLAVSSAASLFTHEGDDHRIKINKASATDTASHLFQTGYSGRAEFGLTGDDDFHVKVSADGAGWNTGLVIDRTTGAARFPSGLVHPASGKAASLLLPCPVVPEIWRSDAARPATPRTYTIASVGGAAVTLTEARVPEIFHPSMQNVSMVRIWNMSKSPVQSAWVDWNNSDTAFNVNDAADIAQWAAGDTLQLGDPNPTGTNALSMIAIDISNFLYNTFGAVFAQKGVLLATYASGSDGDASVDGSGSGAAGSATGTASATDGKRQYGAQTLFTPQRSPISDSNLVFLRESLGTGTALGICYMRLQAVYV